MKKKISDLKRVLQQFSLIAQQLLQENNELKKKCSDQQSDLKQIRLDNSDLERDLGKLRGEYNSLLSECESLRKKAEQKEQVKKKKEELIQENSNLRSQVEKLETRVRELEDRIKQKDEKFYTSISGMLETIQQRCDDNGVMVSGIKIQINGLSSTQTSDMPPEVIEKLQDEEMTESDMQDHTNENNGSTDNEPLEIPSNHDDAKSTEPNDENDTSSSGGFNFGGDF